MTAPMSVTAWPMKASSLASSIVVVSVLISPPVGLPLVTPRLPEDRLRFSELGVAAGASNYRLGSEGGPHCPSRRSEQAREVRDHVGGRLDRGDIGDAGSGVQRHVGALVLRALRRRYDASPAALPRRRERRAKDAMGSVLPALAEP